MQLPPTFTSATGSVFVVITGVAGVSFSPSQFSFQYLAQPSTRTSLLRNITTTMNMGTARLTPQVYGGLFPAGYTQRWLIQAPSPLITFTFSNYSFPSTVCSGTITVYDSANLLGRKLFQGCLQSQMPQYWFYSTTGVALVIVSGGPMDTILNFELTYVSDSDWFQCGSFSQPAVMEGDSMILTDGTKSTVEMRRSLACTWIIAPTTSHPVTLILDWAQIKYGGSVTVYDGRSNDIKNAVLWSGVGATTITPPPITSTGNALFITYVSSSQQSVGYRGFRGQYQTNRYGSVGLGRGYSIMTMSTALNIQPPGDAQEYSSNLNYTWYIQPTSVKGKLTFAISYLDLTSDESLILYDGPSNKYPVMKVFRGNVVENQWYKSTYSNATLVFISKRQQKRIGGFRISYFGDGNNYHCGFTTNPATLVTPSMTITDGSFSSEGIFPSQNCQWNIAPQNSQGVFLFFNRFSLENGGIVTIYNGSVNSKSVFSSIQNTEAVPVPISLSDSSLLGVSYTTTGQSLGLGFSASYFGLATTYSGPGDGIVWLKCSSILSLKVERSNTIPLTNLTFIIRPESTGSLYITFASLNISDCSNHVDIYDGSDLTAKLLSSFCGNSTVSPYSWVQTSSAVALIHFVSPPGQSFIPTASFDLAYFSQGPNYHCGFHRNPGIQNSPSMIFTDGSSPSDPMYPDQHCEWLLSPSYATNVVLQFISNDMTGGKLAVYDGSDDTAALLWSCDSCRSVPQAIVSSSSTLYVVFTTSSRASLGAGFTAAYWSTTSSDWIDSSQGYLLEIPLHYKFNIDQYDNSSGYWQLDVTYDTSTLAYHPTYLTTEHILESAVDGRTELSSNQFSADTRYKVNVCGNLISGTATAIGTNMLQRASQKMGSYVTAGSVTDTSKTIDVTGSSDTTTAVNTYDLFVAAPVCKYEINSGSILAVVITVSNFQAGVQGAFLRIYGGLNDHDALLFDSSSYTGGSFTTTAPCGQALIVIGSNETTVSRVDYGFQISYAIDSTDGIGGAYLSYKCNVYSKLSLFIFHFL